MTSLAMCLDFYGCKIAPNGGFDQMEDSLLAICDEEGLVRGDPGVMKLLGERFGLKDELIIVSGWESVGNTLYQHLIPHIGFGKPAIVHGEWTRSGHIVCIDGVRLEDGDPVQWHFADPYGEWYSDGYRINRGGDRDLGRYWMSHASFTATALRDGILWCHLIEKS